MLSLDHTHVEVSEAGDLWSTSIWQTAVSPVPLACSSLDTPREHAAELILDILHVTQPPSLSVEVSTPVGRID